MSLVKLSFATAASFLTIKFYMAYERWVFCLQMLAVVTQVYVTSNERWHLCLWCLEFVSLLQDLQQFTICSTVYFLVSWIRVVKMRKEFLLLFLLSILSWFLSSLLSVFFHSSLHPLFHYFVLLFLPLYVLLQKANISTMQLTSMARNTCF